MAERRGMAEDWKMPGEIARGTPMILARTRTSIDTPSGASVAQTPTWHRLADGARQANSTC